MFSQRQTRVAADLKSRKQNRVETKQAAQTSCWYCLASADASGLRQVTSNKSAAAASSWKQRRNSGRRNALRFVSANWMPTSCRSWARVNKQRSRIWFERRAVEAEPSKPVVSPESPPKPENGSTARGRINSLRGVPKPLIAWNWKPAKGSISVSDEETCHYWNGRW